HARFQPSVKKLLKDSSRHFDGSPYTSPVNDFAIAPNTPSFVPCVSWASAGVTTQSTIAASVRRVKRCAHLVRIPYSSCSFEAIRVLTLRLQASNAREFPWARSILRSQSARVSEVLSRPRWAEASVNGRMLRARSAILLAPGPRHRRDRRSSDHRPPGGPDW